MKKIVPKVIDKYDDYRRRFIPNKDYDYRKSLEIAFLNNGKLDIDIPDFKFDESFSLKKGSSQMQKVMETIHKTVYNYPFQLIAFNCFFFTIQAQQALKEQLGIESIITLGSYSDKGTKIFYESFQKLKYRLKNESYNSKGINLHAWLTLPDYSLLDVTILSALKFYNQFKNEDYRQFFYLNTEYQNRNNRLNYHPMLVGMEFLTKINITPFEMKVSVG